MSIASPGNTKPLPKSIQEKLDKNWVRTGVHAEGTCFFHSWATAINRCQATDQSCGHQFRIDDVGSLLNEKDWNSFWKKKGIDPVPDYKKAEETMPSIRGKKAWAYDALIVYCLEKKGYNYIFFDARAGKPFCGIFGTLPNASTVVILWLDKSHFEPMGFRDPASKKITYLFQPNHPEIERLEKVYKQHCSKASLRDIVGGGETSTEPVWKVLLKLKKPKKPPPAGSVILYHRPTCKYCREYMPVFDAVAAGKPHVSKVDLSDDEDAKKRYGFATVPTVVRINDDGSYSLLEHRSKEETQRFVGGGDSTEYTYAFDRSIPIVMQTFITTTIQDSRGWRGMGYYFRQMATKDVDMVFYLKPNQNIIAMFTKEMDGFSVCYTVEGKAKIYINQDNWETPPATFTGSQETYRQYVVQHEVGHALGMGHEEAQLGQPCHPMYQQTRGTSQCSPNPWIAAIKK